MEMVEEILPAAGAHSAEQVTGSIDDILLLVICRIIGLVHTKCKLGSLQMVRVARRPNKGASVLERSKNTQEKGSFFTWRGTY